ncbi:MAG: hypothetical protein ACYCO0_05170 [Candidatus Micrarchaeaceae archaeon]
MADDVNPSWNSQTDTFVREIDVSVSKKYGISLRKLLLDPQEYEGTGGIAEKAKSIRADVDLYFDDILASLSKEEEDLERNLESSDSVYTQINQIINSRSGIGRVPFIKPADMSFGDSSPEIVYIDQYNSQVDALITKLVNISNYICDISSTYRKYTIGTWVFSGSRSYVLAVNAPTSPVISVENSRDQIDLMLDQAMLGLAKIS